jgi:protein-tyrosine phosphatase
VSTSPEAGLGDHGVFDVLMVCMGNICRSPMAELYARWELDRLLGEEAGLFRVHSAGTEGLEDWPINPPAAGVLTRLGITSETFRARRLVKEMVASADLVLCATRRQRAHVINLLPQSASRIFTLLEFARLLEGVDMAKVRGEGVVEQARALVAAAYARRGYGRFEPADDDIADPYGQSETEFDRCGVQITEALRPICSALAGNSAG